MDTKERRTGYQTGPTTGPAPAPDPIWRPAHRSRGEKRLKKNDADFKGASRKIFWSSPLPGMAQDLSLSRAVSGVIKVATIVMIESAMM